MTQIQIDYDDNVLDWLNSVNQALHEHARQRGDDECIQVVDDGLKHDAYMICNLVKRPISQSSERI
jgi:hypothetical protein